MERIITGDETWVYEFDLQTGQQVPEGQAVIKEYYLAVLKRLCEKICQKPNLVSCDFFLFPGIKLLLQRIRFNSIEAVK